MSLYIACLNIMTQNVDPKITKPTLEPKYNTTDYYAITIQPSDKLQFHGKKPLAKIQHVRQHFYSLMLECQIPYYINLEISEPIGSLSDKSTGGRLHYHGIIKFDNKSQIRSFLLEYQYKLLRQSRVEISKIADKDAWLNYINKQQLIPPAMRTLSNWDHDRFIRRYKGRKIPNGEKDPAD